MARMKVHVFSVLGALMVCRITLLREEKTGGGKRNRGGKKRRKKREPNTYIRTS